MNQENLFLNSAVLIARNPFGLFKEFNPTTAIHLARLEKKTIKLEDIEPSPMLTERFTGNTTNEVDSQNSILQLEWEGQNYGQVIFDFIPGVKNSNISGIRFINNQGHELVYEPNIDFAYDATTNLAAVKIFDFQGNVGLVPFVPKPDSWQNIVGIFHEKGHFQHLLQIDLNALNYYRKSLVRFDAMKIFQDSLKETDEIDKSLFSVAEYVEVLRQEHIANTSAFEDINHLCQHLDLPDDLKLNMHKKLVRNYRTYCAWANITLAYYK